VYPIGYTVGQPGPIGPAGPGNMGPRLTAAFPDEVANNQTLRMIVRPNVAGRRWRVRLTNVLGTAPVTFDRASVALQDDGAEIVGGTSRTLTFSGRRSVTVAAGDELASDPVRLRVANPRAHSLAISLYLRAPSGPMTWHAASFTTSYITDPNAGDHTGDETEEAFPHSTTSWFFLAGVDVRRRDTATVVAYGDSITDGFFSSINGHDRWPDVLQRRLARRATRSDGRPQLISVANQGIAGNMVTRVGRLPGGCAPCDGPPAVDRLDRDVLSQPGVRAVIFMMGINDLGGGGATAAQVIAGMKDIIRRVHERDIEIIGATLTPSGGTEFGLYGTPATDAARREVNDFIRNGGMFDGVADFSAVTEDPANPGHLRPAYDTHSSVGGPGDHLHPNRAGLLAMGRAVDVAQLEGFVRSDR
jgi:lysophospholipase L1-like esterase